MTRSQTFHCIPPHAHYDIPALHAASIIKLKSAPKTALSLPTFVQEVQAKVKMAEFVDESENKLEPDAKENKEEGPSAENILKQITECFGEGVGKAFQGEKWLT